MSIIAYIRVSSADQNLARQEIMAQSIKADKIFAEKVSGKSTADRPQLKKMLEYLREGDTLHVESISRLARSTRDLLAIVDILRNKGVEFVSHKENIDTTTPTGRFTLTIFAAIAELERESTALRRNEGIEAARKAGKKFGRPPVNLPDNWPRILKDYKEGNIPSSIACAMAGISKTTFYRLLSKAS